MLMSTIDLVTYLLLSEVTTTNNNLHINYKCLASESLGCWAAASLSLFVETLLFPKKIIKTNLINLSANKGEEKL